MRIAVVAQTAVFGGAENYLNKLHAGMAQRGHEPHLFGHVPGWHDRGLAATALNLGPKWGRATIRRGIVALPAERRAVLSAARSTAPAVMHVQFKREQLGLTDVLSRVAPVVWTEHGRFPSDRRARRALSFAYRIAARRAAGIICVSSIVADDVQHAVGGRCPVMLVENAVDTHELRPPSSGERRKAREVLGIVDNDLPVLLWIGRLTSSKLPMLALETAEHWPGVTLVVGDGPERFQLERRSPNMNVRLLGHLEQPLLAYRAADVVLFTSTGAGEGFPTTILEAAAHGLPVIANQESGMGSIVREAGGEVRSADPRALAEAALQALGSERGRLARVWAEAHDVEAWLRQHEEIFRSVCGQA